MSSSLRPIARKQPLPGRDKTIEAAQVVMADAKPAGFIGLPGQRKPQLIGADQLRRSWYLKGSMRGKLKQAGWNNAFLTQIPLQFANVQMRSLCRFMTPTVSSGLGTACPL